MDNLNTLNASLAGSPEDAVYRKITYHLIPFLFVCYCVAYVDRINIGVAKLQMLRDLGFSESTYAWGAGIFFWGYMLLEVPSNLLLHRFGARTWIARIMISWGIVSAAIAYVAPIAQMLHVGPAYVFYVLRFLLGICEAGFFPGMVLYMSYWFPSHRQTQVTLVFLLGLPVSVIVGAPLSGWILDGMNGIGSLRGWQWMFIVEGITSVLIGVAVAFLCHENPRSAGWLSDAEKQLVHEGLRTQAHDARHNFAAALTDARVWILCAIYLCYATGFYGLAFWLPTMIHLAGIDNSFHVGLLNAVPYIVAAGVMTWLANHSRRTGERRLHTAIPTLVAGLALVFSALFSKSIPLSMFFMTISVSGVVSVMTVFWTLPSNVLSGAAAAGGIAVISSVGSLSGFLGSLISSWALTLTGDIRNGTYALAVFMMLSGVIALLAPRSIFARNLAMDAEPPFPNNMRSES